MQKIGLVVGGGTGPEVAEVFRDTLDFLARRHGLALEVVKCGHQPKTYFELRRHPHSDIEDNVREDVAKLEAYYRDVAAHDIRCVFRTAINAEALYILRRKLKAIKEVSLVIPGDRRLFLVRDEHQGYYVNDTFEVEADHVRYSGSFRREGIERITRHAEAGARDYLRVGFTKWVCYKHHLFANRLEEWVQGVLPDASVFQPDTCIHKLFGYIRDGDPDTDLMLIVGNEIGDVLHEAIVLHLKLGTKETLFTKNVYLEPGLRGLVEYQTMHGSADDVAGAQLVNPLATIRAAAAMLEEQFGVSGVKRAMDAAVREAQKGGIRTKDLGGTATTRQMMIGVQNCYPDQDDGPARVPGGLP